MKLSYEDAEEIIDGNNFQKISEDEFSSEIIAGIQNLAKMADKIRLFYSPRAQSLEEHKNEYYKAKNGELIDTYKIGKGKSHDVVEALMVTANSVVATVLKESNQDLGLNLITRKK